MPGLVSRHGVLSFSLFFLSLVLQTVHQFPECRVTEKTNGVSYWQLAFIFLFTLKKYLSMYPSWWHLASFYGCTANCYQLPPSLTLCGTISLEEIPLELSDFVKYILWRLNRAYFKMYINVLKMTHLPPKIILFLCSGRKEGHLPFQSKLCSNFKLVHFCVW